MANLVEIIVAGKDQGAKQLMRDVGGSAQQQEGQFKALAGGITRTAGALGLAVTAGTAFKATIGAGFTRVMDLENANKRLTQMGLSTSRIDGLMGGLTETVSGTSFKLNDAAGIMAQFVSSGMGLDVVNRRMELTADTAAFAQVPLNEIGGIFRDIQTEGRLTGETLNMLQERGVPALELLASAAGVTAEQMRAMISGGEVDAERFFRLWEEGSQGFGDNAIKIEGSAQSMGDTLSGSLANAQTGLGRLGATIADDLAPALRVAADGVTSLVNGFVKLDDFNTSGEEALEKLKGDIEQIGKWLGLVDDTARATGKLDRATQTSAETLDQWGRIAQNASDNAEDFAGVTAELEEQASGLTDELKSQQKELDNLAKTMFEAGGGVLNVRDAQRGLEKAIDDASDAIEENGETLDRNTEEGRANEAALDDIASSAHDLAESQLEAGESGETMRGSMERARKKFLETADSMGMGEEAAKDLADELGLIPSEVKTTAKFRDEATRKIANLQAQLAAITRQINIRANISVSGVGGVERLAALGTRFMATGGIVGAAQDGGPRGRPTVINEARPEVLDLPDGTRVIPSLDQAFDRNQMSGDGQSEVVATIRAEDLRSLAHAFARALDGSTLVIDDRGQGRLVARQADLIGRAG